jgi:hypothetical protein
MSRRGRAVPSWPPHYAGGVRAPFRLRQDKKLGCQPRLPGLSKACATLVATSRSPGCQGCQGAKRRRTPSVSRVCGEPRAPRLATVADLCERLASGADLCERPASGADLCERPASVAGLFERPATVAGLFERLASVAGLFERPASGADLCERPASGAGLFERPASVAGLRLRIAFLATRAPSSPPRRCACRKPPGLPAPSKRVRSLPCCPTSRTRARTRPSRSPRSQPRSSNSASSPQS